MKNYFIIIIFILVNNTYSQEYSAVYAIKCTLTQLENETKTKNNENEFFSHLDTDSDGIEFNLIFSKNNSLFSYIGTLKKNGERLNLSRIKAEITGAFYLDIKNGIRYNKKTVYGNSFIVKDSINMNWVLINEQKKIGVYNCYKAIFNTKVHLNDGDGKIITKDKTVIAWYAPEIPFSTGPTGFSGLPGLILELYDDIFVYYLKSLDLHPQKEIKIIMPEKGKLISKKEFDIVYKELRNKREEEQKKN